MNPYLVLGIGASWLASLVAVGYWQNDAGHTDERSAWVTRENEQLIEANHRIASLNLTYRESERKHAESIARISSGLEQEKQRETQKRDRAIADLRSDNLRLRDPGTVNLCSDGNPTAPSLTAPGKRDGGSGAKLSTATSEFLVGLASDADEIVNQLTACQAVILSDREVKE